MHKQHKETTRRGRSVRPVRIPRRVVLGEFVGDCRSNDEICQGTPNAQWQVCNCRETHLANERGGQRDEPRLTFTHVFADQYSVFVELKVSSIRVSEITS